MPRRKRTLREFQRAERKAVWRRRWRIALVALAATYFASMVLDGAGCSAPLKVLPHPFAYFTQVSALFPRAAHATIDYRAEAWHCSRQAWVELDTRPYFPIARDDKENRFNRAMHFYRENRKTMRALDRYLTTRHDEHPGPDGINPGDRIGGVRFLSLRIPIPKVGSDFERYERRDLSHYPESERKYFYHTTETTRARRCRSDVWDEEGD
jgi:hypothetical protein